MVKTKRIYFVDFARSFAIVLALTDHSMNDFGVWKNYPESVYVILKTLTTSATPTFLLLFGMMLEIIYLKRYRKEGVHKISYALVKRSFQCYVGYFLTVLAGIAGGLLSWKQGFAAAVFFGNCHFGNILKLYTIMLLLAIPLVWYRNRYGVVATLILCVSPWLLYPVIQQLPVLQNNLAIFTSSIFGFGNSGGPSILNSLTLVGIGMLSASFISLESRYAFQIKTLVVIALLAIVLIAVVVLLPVDQLVYNHTHNIFRNQNHPVYYLFSSMLGLLVAILSSLLIPIGKKVSASTDNFLVFGRSSLTAFTAGNIILNLIAGRIATYSWTFWAPLSFVVIVFSILVFYEKIFPRLTLVKSMERSFRGIVVRFQWFYVRRIANSISRVIPR
ncbi:MAG: DUF1624 domain-containing protein [Cyclobacteriaceae bacterium]|nr:DUF1624 domain-containing protein [Cyclobacteriaceae bacterium]